MKAYYQCVHRPFFGVLFILVEKVFPTSALPYPHFTDQTRITVAVIIADLKQPYKLATNATLSVHQSSSL